MLFNSYEFILLFLPVTLFIFLKIGGRGHHKAAVSWLVGASLFYYGWWNPVYLGLILGSIVFNYSVGLVFGKWAQQETHRISLRRALLFVGIAFNLGLLCYYKYFNFFIENVNNVIGSRIQVETIILPLAISFFTFQQITYLVDAYRRETREYNFLHYSLFVTFFPQLIAGPIVHHKEMLPQFQKESIYKLDYKSLAVGLTFFVCGLFKKVVLADGIAVYSTPVFQAAEAGSGLTFFEAWGGALAFTFQLYFDFSGYSDMAVGLGQMIGIRLPLNFFSPYKAVNIIEFWRRWHMTLSRFLRDYLYIPLGGNSRGKTRRYVNIMITMLLGGLWHGAGWTFVLWGALHGLYLILNHAWRAARKSLGHDLNRTTRWGHILSQTVTFTAVVAAWVLFRAETFTGAVNVFKGMAGLNGAVLDYRLASVLSPLAGIVRFEGMGIGAFGSVWGLVFLALLLFIALFLPNTQEFTSDHETSLKIYRVASEHRAPWTIRWDLTKGWAVIMAILTLIAVFSLSSGVSEFLYYQF